MEDTSIKPVITVPQGQPPTELLIEDLVEGDGQEAVAGMQVTVDYAGINWSNGREFDASWNRNDTFAFGLGAGMVISGWDQGVQGMKVGGRRRLTIPPAMAYGSQGAGGVIAPNETLIFVVDLRSVG
ncbi:MAG: FKBP-type peptidyl-prolyl cis-trans isomerase [Acidimicrobiales bacterium]|nr:FKBP-type peptidyl-prolyl cis-trans isomerase [Acidimicrobiales bacterium]RZV46710.1 MAG: FKBP-type peptidyl-prolyl cis-trans isomerase [Acidimicrobiales bacterium]